jgi:hypothetical protein
VNDPGINNWNMSLAKNFAVRESHRLEVRVETYNTFNHTQWMAATTSMASASFGRIGSARPARQIQGGLFYRF